MARLLVVLIALPTLAAVAPAGVSIAAAAPTDSSAVAAQPDDDADDSPSSDDDDDDDDDAETSAKDDGADDESTDDDKQASQDESDDEKPSDDADDDAKPAEKKEPETHVVETKDLTIEVEVDGVFVAEDMEEVALRPETWATFQVKRAVAHGERIRKGDVLVEFDDEDFEKSLAERSLQMRVGEVALMEAEEEFPRLERSIEIDYELAERAYNEARDEYKRFQDTMRELSEKLAEYYLKSAKQDLDNAREELAQLQKMYEADELTEETEEIVLKRQKFQVEVAEFSLEYSQINRDLTIDIAIPQRDKSLQTAVEQTRIAFERAKMKKTLGLSKERYELEALREARARSVDAHGKLVADRALMRLRAPRDGVAYYGRCVNGRWMEVGSLETKLIPFGSVTPNSVLFTVVERLPIVVESSVGEKELTVVKKGQVATLALAADAEDELDAKVESIADVPGSGNKFKVRLTLDDEDSIPGWLMPGMTCKAKIVTYETEDAVVIPADLLQTDDDDPDKKYVMVLGEEDEDESVRRDVKLGKTKDKNVEVLRGLAEGDRIVKGAKDGDEKPESDE